MVKRYVDIGDRVKAGQLLAEIAVPEDGWVTRQQGDTDRYSLQARQHATQSARYNTGVMQAQLSYSTGRRSTRKSSLRSTT